MPLFVSMSLHFQMNQLIFRYLTSFFNLFLKYVFARNSSMEKYKNLKICIFFEMKSQFGSFCKEYTSLLASQKHLLFIYENTIFNLYILRMLLFDRIVYIFNAFRLIKGCPMHIFCKKVFFFQILIFDLKRIFFVFC